MVKVQKPYSKPATETFRPLTKDEISAFLKDKNADPIDVENINNYSIILCKDKDKICSYELTCKASGKVKTEGTRYEINRGSAPAVSVGFRTGGNAKSGKYNYVWISFNDIKIAQKAHKIKIHTSDRREIVEIVQKSKKGIIVSYGSKKARVVDVTIYDEDGNVLYTNKY